MSLPKAEKRSREINREKLIEFITKALDSFSPPEVASFEELEDGSIMVDMSSEVHCFDTFKIRVSR